jgi:hypothetical protein
MKKKLSALLMMLLLTSVGVLVASPAAAVACWTSFNPGSPQGGAMTHYYRNCGSTTSTVSPYYTASWGTMFYSETCKTVGPGETVFWSHGSTVRGAQYSTAICAETYLYAVGLYPETAGRTYPCNTTFERDGSRLYQHYGNCANDGGLVTTAWRTANGNLYASSWGRERVDYGETAIWRFSSTVSANYTTVFVNIGYLG